MSRLLVRDGVFSRGPFRGGLGEDELPAAPAAVDSAIVNQIDARTAMILKKLEAQERARKWTLIIGGASALFAAVKLGLVAFPAIRSRVGGG